MESTINSHIAITQNLVTTNDDGSSTQERSHKDEHTPEAEIEAARALAMKTPAVAQIKESGKEYAVRAMPVAGVDFGVIDRDRYFRQYLQLSAHQVLKSIILSAQGQHVMAVLPVDERINIVAVARAIGKKKGTIVSPDEARELTGLQIGAIGPLGMKTPMPVVVDVSALRQQLVAVSAGTREAQVVLAPADLIDVTAAITADIVKHPAASAQ
ncbi:MAG: YbaK/EbsC family protein [Actinomycetaceae bacterium]|nr:YbaK/EbsC family protein [Actinomycetaceae bacterium]MDY6082419.1 YbaK/EbsC family protein [Actinomycetaceae bacterium]